MILRVAIVCAVAVVQLAGSRRAARPAGEPAGHGSQRLGVEAIKYAHAHFSADACLAAVDIVVAKAVGPKGTMQDQFSFTTRSPSLSKMRYDVRVCFPSPDAPPDPRCTGEWEFEQSRVGTAPICLGGRPADSGEALLVASKNGLPKAPGGGLRLSLRPVAKAGKGLAKNTKLRGRNVWIIESRDMCHAIDALNLQLLYRGSCAALGWPE